MDFSRMKGVPRPEDDDPDKVREAIAILDKHRHNEIMQLAHELHYDPDRSDSAERVMNFCHGQNDYHWHTLNLGIDTSRERLEECIEQMRHLAKRDPNELLKTQLLAHYVGLEYREIRLSLDDETDAV